MRQLNRINSVFVEKNKTAKWLSEKVGRSVASVSCGSAPAVIEANGERSCFLIEIPCRVGFSDRVLIGDDFIEPLN